ncbi:hypothetical protein PQR15_26400 [Streptomyces lydicus]|nr:hypothetical protein [Streptomyces lydicus]
MTVRFLPPAARPADPGRLAGRAASTVTCGRFGPQVVEDVNWRAQSGRWYLLAAGGGLVTGLDATGGVRATAKATALAAPAPGPGARAEVVGRLGTAARCGRSGRRRAGRPGPVKRSVNPDRRCRVSLSSSPCTEAGHT